MELTTISSLRGDHRYPKDDVKRQADAYKTALDTLSPGDVTTIFTPDDTHFEIAKYAIERGMLAAAMGSATFLLYFFVVVPQLLLIVWRVLASVLGFHRAMYESFVAKKIRLSLVHLTSCMLYRHSCLGDQATRQDSRRPP